MLQEGDAIEVTKEQYRQHGISPGVYILCEDSYSTKTAIGVHGVSWMVGRLWDEEGLVNKLDTYIVKGDVMEIDIREECSVPNVIRFDDEKVLKEITNRSLLVECEVRGSSVLINKDTIDDMIKALEKAKELWR